MTLALGYTDVSSPDESWIYEIIHGQVEA